MTYTGPGLRRYAERRGDTDSSTTSPFGLLRYRALPLSWNEAANAPNTLPLVRAVSLFNHFQPFSVGIIDLRDVFFFLFLTGCFVWGTLRALEARQWRGRR